jgi:peptide deformylase
VALLPIRVVPDPVLRQVCAPVTLFDDALHALIADMFATMYAAPGRGLAAPQVGQTVRVFVMDAGWKTGDPAPIVFVNPVLTLGADRAAGPEGCLSIPDVFCDVDRAQTVQVTWQDAVGKAQSGDFTGFAAVCIQHEADHLDGILCSDRVAV